MTGFVGEYLHTVDDKGRLALPVKFRDSLGPRFIIARGLDKCLFVYPHEEWSNIMDKLKALPLNQKDGRNFVRYFLSGATEVEPDKQGRVILQQNLRDYAGLNKEVFVLGVGSRIEIWDKETWENAKRELEDEFSVLAESVVGI
ncbi:MAG TPA: division/cell wall cluster transcriptional repressor MraZ [Bacillota bacterium]|nr:division/cell wall cluster transcriptional repressor MraZ [Candidatus Fermentithermobacillaceae bacterium]HOB29907.1 division/cell wall cluster transcriptional repressor MraZ [Bacillota bacterium]HOK63777.1 division/cell wall cluster transcriptional repressor MraZ [Bacillota bacterium]HOL11535.1 division/cell wall cluster transcriptional repressor MraZ [Bacillota bacterium]HOQ02592.1 division/cell wall cluster transcriptional repressor MraZ [Bacillota bacterium]